MEPVLWTDTYATGHGGIDAQHRVLFRLLEQARMGVDNPHHDAYRQIVLDLIKYVIEHFGYEYALMREHEYPDKAGHHAYHQGLIQQVVGFKERIFSNQDARAELASFLTGWILHHIGNDDVRLAAYLQAKGIVL